MAQCSFLPHSLAADASLRLVCLPYAGGGTAVFHRWRPLLPAAVGLVPVCLPGRESRISEPPCPDLRAVVRPLADELAPYLDRPWAALGHSMGAWVALELVRELRRRGAPQPMLLIVAASRAPDVVEPGPPLTTLPDGPFLDALSRRFGGIPPAVRGHAELLELLLPALRADIHMAETYQYEEGPPLETEILALGGTDDPAVSATQLAQWRRHTAGKFSARLLPGDHFFLFRRPDAEPAENNESEAATPALRTIVARLTQYLDTTPARLPGGIGDEA
jgi:surfactin synthase thioesterase subunit